MHLDGIEKAFFDTGLTANATLLIHCSPVAAGFDQVIQSAKLGER